MTQVILFDFYGVFLPDEYGTWLQSNGLERSGIFTELMNDLDMDKITEDVFFDKLSKTVGREVTNEEFHPHSSQEIAPDVGVTELVRNLHSIYHVGLLSNASTKLRPKLHDLNLAELFDTIIISAEIGHAKPSDTAFQIALEKLGVAAQEVFFIDDNPANIDAAKRNGLQAVQYTSLSNLKITLKEHHLIESNGNI